MQRYYSKEEGWEEEGKQDKYGIGISSQKEITGSHHTRECKNGTTARCVILLSYSCVFWSDNKR
jgi:hypothetical protein